MRLSASLFSSLYSHSGYYDEFHVDDRITGLVPTMIKQRGKTPKLRCSAAQARALVSFCKQQVDLHFNADEQELAASVAMTHLAKCYDALSVRHGNSLATLKLHSRLFAAQLVALETVFDEGGLWRTKPKLHQILEIF